MSEKKIVLLGYGEMGHAFEQLLHQYTPLTIWSRSTESAGGETLEQAVASAGYVILCLPVVAHTAVAKRLAGCLPRDAICISIAKGLDDSGKPALHILNEHLPLHSHVVIYGPMIAEEIIAGRVAFAQLGTTDDPLAETVSRLFKGTPLYLQATHDMVGISWAVILKNVYAILFGVADEMKLGDNMRGYLMAQSLAELASIVELMGGDAHTAFGLAGLGDLVTTATSESSHHHSLGRCLARNDCAEISGEGVHTLQMVVRHRLIQLDDYPLFKLCERILDQPPQCRELVHDFLANL